MKLIQVGPDPNERGGIASVISVLSAYNRRTGIDEKIIPTAKSGGHLFQLAIFFSGLFKIVAACLTRSVNIVHIHMSSRGSCMRKSIVAIACRVTGTPFIIHLHGGDFDKYFEQQISGRKRKFISSIFSSADATVALSNYWKDWLLVNMKLKNVQVISNGTLEQDITKIYTNPTKNILFLGRLCDRKGTDVLIDAARKLSGSYPNVRFELGGDGDLDFYKPMASDLGNIFFLGWLNESDRDLAYQRAYAFCLPSRNEGLPMSILEAMSRGIPVVSTNVGGIPDAIENGISGILIPPSDSESLAQSLKLLLDNDSLAASMGNAARLRHKTLFGAEIMCSSFRDLYTKIISARNNKL